jgi:Sensors of blue-light using FAD
MSVSDENFYQLIYVSEPVAGLSELMDMISKAQKYNLVQEISGILVVKSKSVLQLIEGPEDKVKALYKKIEADTRHQNPAVIYEGYSAIRNMPFLGMALTIDFEEDDGDRKIFLFDKKEAIKFGMLIKGPVKEYLMSYLEHK